MKKNLVAMILGLSLLLSSCQVATSYEPEFRTLDHVLQYLDSSGQWIPLYDFSNVAPLVPVDVIPGEDGVDGMSVLSAEITDAQELIFHYSDGHSENLGCIAPELSDAELFQQASINDSGELLLVTTTGEELNLGQVVGPQGQRGFTGPPGPTGPTGPTGRTGASGADGADGVGVATSKDEAELFTLTTVSYVDVVALVGEVLVSGVASQVINDELVLDFGNKTLVGDLLVETPYSGVVQLIDGTLEGNLTASGANASFVNYLSVTGDVTIEVVSENTWNQYGNVNTIFISAPEGSFNFMAGTIASNIQIIGNDRTKPLTFRGNSLQVPIVVYAGVEIILEGFAADEIVDIQVPTPRTLLDEDIRQKVSIVNRSECLLQVNKSTSLAQTIENTTQNKLHFTIQQAIDDANDGDTVYVGAGEYQEHLTISKAINLVAYDGVTLCNPTIGEETIGISVGANIEGTIIIDGFELQGYRNGIVTRSPATLKNNTVYAENYGLDNAYLRNGIQVGSTVASANGSIVEYNTVYGAPLTESWAGTAINIVNSSDVIVRHNTVLGDNDIGIGILDFSRVNVSGVQILSNTVIGARNAIRIDGWYTLNPYAVIENIQVEGNELIGNLEDDESYRGINMQWVKVINSAFTTNTFEGFSLQIRVSSSSASSENLLSDDVDVQPIINVTQNRVGYHTIQAAIDAAEVGDTITLKAGVYEEDVSLDKAITLQGLEGGAVVGIVTITNELATIDNITYDTPE